MLEVETNIVIHLPLERVFDYMTNPANMRQWRIDVTKYTDLPTKPFAKGQTWSEEAHHLGRTGVSTVEITDIVQGKYYSMKTLSDKVVFLSTYAFEPVPDGTRISFHIESNLPTMLKMIEPLIRNNSITLIDKNFQQLKALLESK